MAQESHFNFARRPLPPFPIVSQFTASGEFLNIGKSTQGGDDFPCIG